MAPAKQSWSSFGRKLLVRCFFHFFLLFFVWAVFARIPLSASLAPDMGGAGPVSWFIPWLQDLEIAALPVALTLATLSLLWALLGFGLRLWLSLLFSSLSTAVAAAFALFPVPEQAWAWLVEWGPETPRFVQWGLMSALGLAAVISVVRRMSHQYESVSSDLRLALSPHDEDLVYRDLVQSLIVLVGTLGSWFALGSVADVRPVPAVLKADERESRPSVLLLASNSGQQSELLKAHLGMPFFRQWSIFGSPEASSMFDEILHCRYPIRLLGRSAESAVGSVLTAKDYMLPAALDVQGYTVNLLHAASAGEASEVLKIFSRSYAHVHFLRRFGLLLPARVFHTPDVQLAQMREVLSAAVGRGEPAFLSAALFSRNTAPFSRSFPADVEFKTFLEVLDSQGWLRRMMIVLIELPQMKGAFGSDELSLQGTTARVSMWMPVRMADMIVPQNSMRLVRGIDIGASLAARLRLGGVITQCDGAALFDLSERPSLFPRDLVYQELELAHHPQIFRRRGWLSSDGYRLELTETNGGVAAKGYKFSLQSLLNREIDTKIEEVPLREKNVLNELQRQIDDFLRASGVEILNLGEGRIGYSEPFRRVRLTPR